MTSWTSLRLFAIMEEFRVRSTLVCIYWPAPRANRNFNRWQIRQDHGENRALETTVAGFVLPLWDRFAGKMSALGVCVYFVLLVVIIGKSWRQWYVMGYFWLYAGGVTWGAWKDCVYVCVREKKNRERIREVKKQSYLGGHCLTLMKIVTVQRYS